MKTRSLLLVPLLSLAMAGFAGAQAPSAVPDLMNYQAHVTGAGGAVIGASPVNRLVYFRFYTTPTPSGQTLLYSESQTVTINNGEFSVLLGQGAQIASEVHVFATAFTNKDCFLGITVDAAGDGIGNDAEIAPRQQIVATAFSVRSKIAESVASDGITSTMLGLGVVTGDKLGSGAITSDKVAAGAINGSAILDASVASADLANNAVTNAKLADNAVTNAKLADNAVNTAELADNAVTWAKLAGDAVGTIELRNGAVTGNKMASTVGVFSKSGGNLSYLEGAVAIGGSNTSQARFSVWGSGAPGFATPNGGSGTAYQLFRQFNGFTNTTAAVDALSIWAEGSVAGAAFLAISDERIKTVLGRSDAVEDLATIRQIEITDYRHIDVVGKGSRPQKKVIAQQVETIYPQAVSRTTDTVPDIYQNAGLKDGWVELATDLKVGDRVRLIGEKVEGIQNVLEVAERKFRTDFSQREGDVFVFGREVKDFRIVDYEAIAMLNVSATQEIANRLEVKEAEVAALQKRLAELEAKDLARDARDKARDAQLAAIEKHLSADSPPVRTASIKQGAANQ